MLRLCYPQTALGDPCFEKVRNILHLVNTKYLPGKACPKTPLMLLNEFAAQNSYKLVYEELELVEEVSEQL